MAWRVQNWAWPLGILLSCLLAQFICLWLMMPHFLLPPAWAPPNLFFYSFIHSLTYSNMLACFAPVVLEPWWPILGSGAAWVQCWWKPPGLHPSGFGRCAIGCPGIDFGASSMQGRCSTHLGYFRYLLSARLEQNKSPCWSLLWLQRSMLTCMSACVLGAYLYSLCCIQWGSPVWRVWADNRCQPAFFWKLHLKFKQCLGPILSPYDYDSWQELIPSQLVDMQENN